MLQKPFPQRVSVFLSTTVVIFIVMLYYQHSFCYIASASFLCLTSTKIITNCVARLKVGFNFPEHTGFG
jgi:hypothetical protein